MVTDIIKMWKYAVTFVAGIYCGQTYNLPNIEKLVKETMVDVSKYIENAKKETEKKKK